MLNGSRPDTSLPPLRAAQMLRDRSALAFPTFGLVRRIRRIRIRTFCAVSVRLVRSEHAEVVATAVPVKLRDESLPVKLA